MGGLYVEPLPGQLVSLPTKQRWHTDRLACVSLVVTIGFAIEGMTSKVLVTRPRDTSTPVFALRATARSGAHVMHGPQSLNI